MTTTPDAPTLTLYANGEASLEMCAPTTTVSSRPR
jgi:hypothetical protein